MSEDSVASILIEIRNWIKAAGYPSIKALLESALPDEKSRSAYQMLDGNATIDHVRTKCKMSPNTLTALSQKWIAMGLMEMKPDSKRKRLFDLADFGLMKIEE